MTQIEIITELEAIFKMSFNDGTEALKKFRYACHRRNQNGSRYKQIFEIGYSHIYHRIEEFKKNMLVFCEADKIVYNTISTEIRFQGNINGYFQYSKIEAWYGNVYYLVI